METLRNIDWGGVVFIIVGVGVLLLFVQAARRMSAKKKSQAAEGREERKRPPRKKPTRESRGARAKREKQERAQEQKPDQEASEEPTPTTKGSKGNKGKKNKGKPKAKKPTPAPAPEPEEPEEEPARDTAEEQRRLTEGLAKTRGGFIARLGKLFKGKQIDENLLEEVEEVLFTADIGVKTSQDLIEGLRKELNKKQLADADAIWANLKSRTTEMLADQAGAGLKVKAASKPFVLLVIGVNGTGKTTTIGKLAARLKADGHEVMLAAGDTFRAAAVQQLEVWGERSGCKIVSGKEGADPASVIVDALKAAGPEIDVVIADTAGRLHTKSSLMEELQKVRRAIAKHVEGAPHETFLVLDATTGQNAIAQATQFKQAMDITGLVLTKLDGTAKGGVVLGIANELKLPVRFVGIGEQIDDLREFDPKAFVEALFARD